MKVSVGRLSITNWEWSLHFKIETFIYYLIWEANNICFQVHVYILFM